MRSLDDIIKNARLSILLFLAFIIFSAQAYRTFLGNGGEAFLKIKSSPEHQSYKLLHEFCKAFNTGSETKEFFLLENEYEDFRKSFYIDTVNFKRSFKLSFHKNASSHSPEAISYSGSLAFKNKLNSLVDVNVLLYFDDQTKNYLIEDIKLGNISTVASNGINSIVKKIDDINQYSCLNDDQGTNYVRLKHKDPYNQSIIESEYLGDNIHVLQEIIPKHFYQTEAFIQHPFDDREVEDIIFSPGYVISRKDSEEAGLGHLFGKIEDADGTIIIKDEGGNPLTQPTGFFIDSGAKRIVVVTNNNNISFYGRERDHVNIGGRPKYIKYIDGFIYVYDADKNQINIFQTTLSKNSNVEIEYKGNIDLNRYQISISDLSGFAGKMNNFLFLSNPKNNSIVIFKLNKGSGLINSVEQPLILEDYSFAGKNSPLPGRITRFDVSLNNSADGSFSIVALINHDLVASFTGNLDRNGLEINKQYRFESETFLSNLGFNKGEETFIVTDHNGKLHFFSSLGDYLGSDGKIGISENNNELFYPSIITSNLFTDDAKEMIVVNKWGQNTGFKRILPRANLSRVEVLEKYSVLPSKSLENTLLIKYGLTSGYGVEEISISINQLPLKKISDGFYATTYLEELDLNEANNQQLLKNGWNEVKVSLTGKHLLPGGLKSFSQSKTYHFYYHASEINIDKQPLSSSTSFEKDVLTLYKSVRIKGQKTFHLQNCEINIKEGSTLEVSSETPVNFKNVKVNFSCSSSFQLHVAKDTAKVFDQVTFNGLGENHTMIKTYGEFTGGNGEKSSPSSMLEFLNCKFTNYIGKAIHISEGRSTFVNCEFGEANSPAVGTGIFNAPNSRSDILGCLFTNNDIGIDATGAEVYLSTKKGKYKGIEVNNPEFINNRVGYFGYNSYLRSSNASYTSNTYGIIDIDGVLDLSFKAKNSFSKNEVSVLFSHDLVLERGHNFFEKNHKEIVFLGDKSELNLDVSCNYWDKLSEGVLPVIEFTPDMFVFFPYDFSKVKYYPYLDNNENQKANCNQSVNWHDSLNTKKIKKDRNDWINGISSSTYFSTINRGYEPLKYGFYPDKDSDRLSKFLYKQTLSSFLYCKRNSNSSQYGDLLKEFIEASYFENPYENVLYDKLVFLGIKASLKDEESSSELKSLSLSIFPNPSSDFITLDVDSNISDVKEISFVMFNQNGHIVRRGNFHLEDKIERKIDISNLGQGIYGVQIFGGKHKAQSRFVKL